MKSPSILDGKLVRQDAVSPYGPGSNACSWISQRSRKQSRYVSGFEFFLTCCIFQYGIESLEAAAADPELRRRRFDYADWNGWRWRSELCKYFGGRCVEGIQFRPIEKDRASLERLPLR